MLIEAGGKSVTFRGRLDDETREAMALMCGVACQRSTPVLVDVGAGEGAFTVLAGLVLGMVVHAFEPNPNIAEVLRANVARNELSDRVSVHECALSDNDRPGFLQCPKQWGLATLARVRFPYGVTYPVRVDTLDGVLRGERIDLLKLDVEGAEKFVLLGGKTMIRRHRPVILAETQDKRTRQFCYAAKDITELLRGWGYEALPVTCRDTLYQHESNYIEIDLEEVTRCLQFSR